MLHAKCDESYAHSIEATSHYVVAGYTGDEELWTTFVRFWSQTLREFGANEHGYHASDCQRGKGAFRRWNESKRREFGYRLVVDIAAARLLPFATVIDMAAYRRHSGGFTRFLGPNEFSKFNRPHVLAARMCAHEMLMLTERSGQRISFVFDRNNEFGRRAIEWLSNDASDVSIEHRDRIAELCEGNRQVDVGLQAADLLAYSTLREQVGDPSWHWSELNDVVPVRLVVADEAFWSPITRHIQERTSGG